MLAAARSKLCRSVSAWSGVFASIATNHSLIVEKTGSNCFGMATSLREEKL